MANVVTISRFWPNSSSTTLLVEGEATCGAWGLVGTDDGDAIAVWKAFCVTRQWQQNQYFSLPQLTKNDRSYPHRNLCRRRVRNGQHVVDDAKTGAALHQDEGSTERFDIRLYHFRVVGFAEDTAHAQRDQFGLKCEKTSINTRTRLRYANHCPACLECLPCTRAGRRRKWSDRVPSLVTCWGIVRLQLCRDAVIWSAARISRVSNFDFPKCIGSCWRCEGKWNGEIFKTSDIFKCSKSTYRSTYA